MNRLRPLGMFVWTAALCAGMLLACATNPVTHKKELSFISEAQEIDMGRSADKDVQASIGLYPDEKLQQYVQALGTSIAVRTERPKLPWTFRVVDDASVNAFAIPGGFVYVTRGILSYMTSEAQLAAVIGHEIGHVTARHSVNQMSKQQLAQVGLIAGMIISPTVAQFGNVAQQGLGLLFLKFSREDESQADSLGFRYMLADGYDPREMVQVFRMLEGVSQQAEAGGRLPQWLSSHPDPENREAWAEKSIGSLNRDLSGLTVNRPVYLGRIDGIIFGDNPREGIFRGAEFHHPDLAFRLQFPAGWKTSNEKQAVGAVSPNQDAVVVLQLAQGTSAQQAAQKFFSQQGVQMGSEWRREIGGFPASSAIFAAQTDQGVIRGLAAFVEYAQHVYQIMGYTSEQGWPNYQQAFAQSIASFARESDPAILNVKPRKLELVSVSRPSTLDALAKQYPSTVPQNVLSLINNATPDSTLPAGTMFKRVVGGPQ